MMHEATRAMTQVAAEGGKVLFVGTKKQAQEVIQGEAERCGMWYVNQRWLGGTLTNFQTIRSRINYMLDLQQKRDQGYFRLLPKKEAVKLTDTLAKLEKYFLGIKDMTAPPAAMFIIDIGKEDLCVAEAQRMGIKDIRHRGYRLRSLQGHPRIPGNDDAVRSIRLVTSRMASAIIEGVAQREALLEERRLAEMAEAEAEAMEDAESEADEEELAINALPLDEIAELMEQASARREQAEGA